MDSNKDQKMCIKCFNLIMEDRHAELSLISGVEKEVSYICVGCYRELTAPTMTYTTDA